MKPRHIVKQALGRKQDVLPAVYGVMGDLNGVVDVPGRRNYSYVNIDGQLAEIYNTRVSGRVGLGVMVGYDPAQPDLQQVLSVRPIERIGTTVTNQPLVQKHARTHEFLAKDGGTDPIFVQLRQIMPLRPEPAGGYLVYIFFGIEMINGAWALVGGSTVDLHSTGSTLGVDNEMFALISLNLTTGAITVTSGSQVTTGTIALTDIPAVPAGHKAICAVRLYWGQAEIVETRTHNDLVDMRWSMVGVLATPQAHKTSHENGGADEISVAGLSGVLVDPQTPATHASTHQSSGTDPVKLDDLATPDDNTDLDATSARHGLLPKLTNTGTKFLRDDGIFVTISTGELLLDDSAAMMTDDNDDLLYEG